MSQPVVEMFEQISKQIDGKTYATNIFSGEKAFRIKHIILESCAESIGKLVESFGPAIKDAMRSVGGDGDLDAKKGEILDSFLDTDFDPGELLGGLGSAISLALRNMGVDRGLDLLKQILDPMLIDGAPCTFGRAFSGRHQKTMYKVVGWILWENYSDFFQGWLEMTMKTSGQKQEKEAKPKP